MYPRFKAFLFLTGLVFGVMGLIAFFQSRTPNLSASNAAADAKPISDGEKSPPRIDLATIPENWRSDLGVPVLCYHQIVTDEKYRQRPTPYAVTVRQFREQMQWLADHNFYTILPDDLLAYVKGDKGLDFTNGKRPIVLTFDDGNNDFVNYAVKILNEHSFKGVLFIYPTYIFARKPRSLTWSQIKNAREANHAIESHTMWHPMLNTMTDTEQRAQFIDSKKNLDTRSGANVKHLAYPFGLYNAHSLDILRETGYQSAYTTFHGGNQIGENPFLLRRYLIVKSDNAKVFAQKTLARSLPLRYIQGEPGMLLTGPTDIKYLIPGNLDAGNLKVKVFSTSQKFAYDKKSGELQVSVMPSGKRLSVLEILYRENGIDYRANALLNHKRDSLPVKNVVKHKRRKKNAKKRHST
jgi:peptidoglycan/xylan/chitin deacetylase (PgdA/CDA1 family)